VVNGTTVTQNKKRLLYQSSFQSEWVMGVKLGHVHFQDEQRADDRENGVAKGFEAGG